MDRLTEKLAAFAVSTRYEDLPAAVIRDAKYLLLDSIGCAIGGVTTDPGKMVVALAQRLGGPQESTILGVNGKVACTNASFANGQLINTLDYDSVMSGGHAPPYVVASVLALAEVVGASGQDLILALALAFEISGRILNSTRHVSPDGRRESFKWQDRAGYANCNIGVAAGGGKLFNLDKAQMMNALGISGHLCQVLPWVRYSFSEHRHMTKYGEPGWQNTGGVMAVLLAEMGYMGDTTFLDDEHGFWKFCGYDGWDPSAALDGLGKKWVFTPAPYKPYPSCGVLHSAIDCLREIMEQNNLGVEDIEKIDAYLPQTVEAPCFTSRELNNIVDIQFGLPYVLAMVANDVHIGPEWQDMDTAREPRIQNFAAKVTLQVNDSGGGPQPSKLVVTAKGKTYTHERSSPIRGRGSDSQFTDAELAEKFRHNVVRILTEDKIKNAVAGLTGLESVENINDIMPNLVM
jgi:2-methylcitrate dehydratase PrpD